MYSLWLWMNLGLEEAQYGDMKHLQMTVFLVVHGVWLRTAGFLAKLQHVVDEVPASLVGPV